MATLFCDPSQRHHLILRFEDRVLDLAKPNGEELLRGMTEVVGTGELTGIDVVNQSESFTLIRVVATIANALAYSRQLQLSVDGEIVDQVRPHYNKGPNISISTHVV